MASSDEPARRSICKGQTKAGNACRSTLVGPDGYCTVHSPSKAFDPIETGRRGGRRSGIVRSGQAKSVRERIAERLEAEADKIAKVYLDAMQATDADGVPEHRVRLMGADSGLAQAYGKPTTHVEQSGVVIVVRHPLLNKRHKQHDLELPAADVAELEAAEDE
jgi:hypothetical protein